jgi:hypothetical protein
VDILFEGSAIDEADPHGPSALPGAGAAGDGNELGERIDRSNHPPSGNAFDAKASIEPCQQFGRRSGSCHRSFTNIIEEAKRVTIGADQRVGHIVHHGLQASGNVGASMGNKTPVLSAATLCCINTQKLASAGHAPLHLQFAACPRRSLRKCFVRVVFRSPPVDPTEHDPQRQLGAEANETMGNPRRHKTQIPCCHGASVAVQIEIAPSCDNHVYFITIVGLLLIWTLGFPVFDETVGILEGNMPIRAMTSFH